MIKYYYLEDWAKELVVDPLSKQSLIKSEDSMFLLSDYGRKYPIVNEIYDLRLLNNSTTGDQKLWKRTQDYYENNTKKKIREDHKKDYFIEKSSVKEIYDIMPIEGNCLDVGGNVGILRDFLDIDQKFISCDPFLNVFDELEKRTNFIKAYPCLNKPLNFICCSAEFLPFMSLSFNTVHMRSVIDHFLNPELSLYEAHRVLKKNGKIIIGSFVHGGKDGKEKLKPRIKSFIKDSMLPIFSVKKYQDLHIWHPTFNELLELISNCGFEITKVYWQKGYHDTVCYVEASKKSF